MLLEHLGEVAAATRLMAAIERVTAEGSVLPRDLGGTATTRQVTDAVLSALASGNV
jgi:tartrate dehydrogenase/decarboxylase/D-malate dehydrogenase